MRKKLLLLMLVLSPITSAFATPATDLTALLNSVKTMQAAFTQTIYDNRGKSIQTSYGIMALDRPGKFRWEVKKPIPQLIVANDKRLWIYDPDLEQVTIKQLNQAAGDTPALLLSHVGGLLETDYTVTKSDQKPIALNWFMLKPKSKDNMFAAIQMGFKGREINEMRLEDHLGHITAIEFKDAKTNGTLPTKLFTFKAPKGVDVIDETRH